MPYSAASITARREKGAARARKHRANEKARLEQLTGFPQASRRSRVPLAYDCADRTVFSFTHNDWAEGRVNYHRSPNPDLNSRATLVLVLTPQYKSEALPIIESDRLPQSATKSPKDLQTYWYRSENGELETTQPGINDRSDSPGCPPPYSTSPTPQPSTTSQPPLSENADSKSSNEPSRPLS